MSAPTTEANFLQEGLHSRSSFPIEFVLFIRITGATLALSLLDALVRWPLQGAKSAFSALFMMLPLADITCFWSRFGQLHTLAFYPDTGRQPWTYPAPCAFLYDFIYRFSDLHTLPYVYLGLGVTLLVVAAAVFSNGLKRAGLTRKNAITFALSVLALSWPIYFSFQRGNIESILWLILALALGFYVRGRWHLAAVALGFVAAFKIYPILFLGLFLAKRRYLEIGEAFVSAGITTFAGLYFLDHNLKRSGRFIAQGIHIFVKVYSSAYIASANGYDHSAWALLKYPLRNHPQFILRAVPAYTLVAGLLATWFFFAKLWKAPQWNQLLALCTLMVFLPATSFDYTLQALYIPFALLCFAVVRSFQVGRSLPGASAFFIAFALLFGPLVFVRGKTYALNGQVKALVLLGLLYLAIRFPLADETAMGQPDRLHPA